MNGSHVAGGTLGATLGAVLASLLNKYGFKVDEATAALIGSVLLATGVGLGHVVSTTGVFPALKQVFFGPKAVPVVTSVSVPAFSRAVAAAVAAPSAPVAAPAAPAAPSTP